MSALQSPIKTMPRDQRNNQKVTSFKSFLQRMQHATRRGSQLCLHVRITWGIKTKQKKNKQAEEPRPRYISRDSVVNIGPGHEHI